MLPSLSAPPTYIVIKSVPLHWNSFCSENSRQLWALLFYLQYFFVTSFMSAEVPHLMWELLSAKARNSLKNIRQQLLGVPSFKEVKASQGAIGAFLVQRKLIFNCILVTISISKVFDCIDKQMTHDTWQLTMTKITSSKLFMRIYKLLSTLR